VRDELSFASGIDCYIVLPRHAVALAKSFFAKEQKDDVVTISTKLTYAGIISSRTEGRDSDNSGAYDSSSELHFDG
jgi:hypothetical protein